MIYVIKYFKFYLLGLVIAFLCAWWLVPFGLDGVPYRADKLLRSVKGLYDAIMMSMFDSSFGICF